MRMVDPYNKNREKLKSKKRCTNIINVKTKEMYAQEIEKIVTGSSVPYYNDRNRSIYIKLIIIFIITSICGILINKYYKIIKYLIDKINIYDNNYIEEIKKEIGKLRDELKDMTLKVNDEINYINGDLLNIAEKLNIEVNESARCEVDMSTELDRLKGIMVQIKSKYMPRNEVIDLLEGYNNNLDEDLKRRDNDINLILEIAKIFMINTKYEFMEVQMTGASNIGPIEHLKRIKEHIDSGMGDEISIKKNVEDMDKIIKMLIKRYGVGPDEFEKLYVGVMNRVK